MKKVAIIYNRLLYKKNKIADLVKNLNDRNIECNVYEKSEDIIASAFIPDCILVIEPHEPKLTEYPTYLVTDESADFLFSTKRFVRNILTYDAYLTSSHHTKKLLEDLIFSSRKIGSEVLIFNVAPNYEDKKISPKDITIFINKEDRRRHRYLTRKLRWNGYTKLTKIEANTQNELGEPVISDMLGLCLKDQELNDYGISYEAIKIIASGSILVTYWSHHLYSIFGNNVFYINKSSKQNTIYNKIKSNIKWAKNNPQILSQKLEKLKEIYKQNFSSNLAIKNLKDLHGRILSNKGYIPHNTAKKALPSISYIMRVGGDCRKIKDTIHSLSKQNYPGLQLLMIAYKPLENFEQIIDDYKDKIKFRIIQDYGGTRSTGIITGMKNVDTEYFALTDDDDTINQNHLLSLMQSLDYHKAIMPNRDFRVAYSGAYFICNTYRPAEEEEWDDNLLDNRPRKRAIEHLRFFDANLMMRHKWYMTSNSWIAHKSLINEETTRDIETNSHEDLYFELQFAMHTNFAFSCEVTAAHHFHGSNSTIHDAYRNVYDKTRRNISLYFMNSQNSLFCRSTPENMDINLNIKSLTINAPLDHKRIIKFPFRRSKKIRKIIVTFIKKIFAA